MSDHDELWEARQRAYKLQKFKDWVHAYLDSKGIPHHPPGTHGAEGCRIGDRMDYVFARVVTRERVEKAVGELFNQNGRPMRPVFYEDSMADDLCRLLGVEGE